MGYGLGAAIGANIATGKCAVLFTGDGSFGMNLTELAAALKEAFSQHGPFVIDAQMCSDELVLPMLPPGGSIDNIITEIE